MPSQFERYGALWTATSQPLAIEFEMIRKGGRFRNKKGNMVGNGVLFHWIEAIKLIWPHIVHHKWNNLFFDNYLQYRTMGVLGPASSGKTNSAAICALLDYYVFPSCTTAICCSTTKERLEDRIWGEIKKLHKMAKERYSWIDGYLIEGRQRIISDKKSEAVDGRDFRNGLIGVPCKKGENYVGLGDFAGIKNKRVRLFGDELSLLPRVFVDAVSNLDKNLDFKGVGMGNPKDTTDALGVFCEPAASLGGWEGGIDQGKETKTWPTRRAQGICIQFPGTDSPNLDGKLNAPLITQEQIDRDISFYGKDSVWFSMMNMGMMPRGHGSRRVLTRQACFKFGAMEEPIWRNNNRVRIAFLDAAYRGVGGDRCVFGHMEFGEEADAEGEPLNVTNLINQNQNDPNRRKILHLVETSVVPIKQDLDELPEDQIVDYVRTKCESLGIVPGNFFFDSGMRTSLVSAFARRWSSWVNPIDCGGNATERKVSHDIDVLCKDYYSKFVTEMWWAVRLTVEARQFRGMTEDVMMEFSSREWTTVGANRIEIEPKDKMKEKTGRSPDLADAVAVGLEGARQRGFVIMRLVNHTDPPKDTENWKRELREKAANLWRSKELNYAA